MLAAVCALFLFGMLVGFFVRHWLVIVWSSILVAFVYTAAVIEQGDVTFLGWLWRVYAVLTILQIGFVCGSIADHVLTGVDQDGIREDPRHVKRRRWPRGHQEWEEVPRDVSVHVRRMVLRINQRR